MAPRSIGELISWITSDDVEEGDALVKFSKSLEEICSHPKDEINNQLINIKDRDIFRIRDHLYLDFLDIEAIEVSLAIHNIFLDSNNPNSNLRKRYKAATCFDDIYYLAISIYEKKAHKEISKAIISSQAPFPAPSITQTESALIKAIQEMKSTLGEIRKENKDLKIQLNLVCTKIDNQNEVINALQQKVNAATTIRKVSSVNTSQKTSNKDTTTTRTENVHMKTPNTENNISNVNQEETNELNPQSHDTEGTQTRDQSNLFSAVVQNGVASPNPATSFFNTGDDRFGLSKGFSLVKPRRQPVFGTKSRPIQNSIAGKRNVRNFSVFIGGLSNETSEEDLTTYMKDELNINPLAITVNKINNYNRSYKITINNKDKKEVFCPDHWEENIIIKPFRERDNTINYNNYHQQSVRNPVR